MRSPSKLEQFAVAAPLALALSACGNPSGSMDNQPNRDQPLPTAGALPNSAAPTNNDKPDILNIYVPTWLEADTCDKLASDLPANKATRFILAFGLPKVNGSIELPEVNPKCVSMLKKLGKTSQISLAIGGYGGDEAEHNEILKNFAAASKTPDVFADGMVIAVAKISKTIGRSVTGIDLDWEYPTADQADDVTQVLSRLNAKLKKGHISMAVAAGGLDIPVSPLVPSVDEFNVMTYDKSGPWEPTAGDIAPADWTISKINEWVTNVGDESKVVVGFPAYGYTYPGATQSGAAYTSGAAANIKYRDIPQSAITDTPGIETPSFAMVDDAWTSIVTPNDIQKTMETIKDTNKNIGGAMVWQIEGMTKEHFPALGKK